MKAAQRIGMVERIRALPGLVEKAVGGLDDRQLDTPYREGGWTVRQVVHHLADSHMNAFIRLKLMLTEDHPTLKPYDQNEWAKLVDTDKAPITSAISILRGLHERWTVLLENIGDDQWSRSAHHPENGTMTIEDLLRIYSGHGEKHVGQIISLRSAKGW